MTWGIERDRARGWRLATGISAIIGIAACGDDPVPLIEPPGGDTERRPSSTESDSSDTTESSTGTTTSTTVTSGPPSTSTTTGPSAGTDTDTSGPAVGNCNELTCTGPSRCVISDEGVASCECDKGYYQVVPGEGACVLDESCREIHPLEVSENCRYIASGPPGVAIHFSVEYCNGAPVPPSALGDLSTAFTILEGGVPISSASESLSTVIPRDVESYVAIVLDVSDSITSSENLDTLITEVRGLAADLEPAQGDPEVYVAVYVFAGGVAEYQPFTRNFAAVDAKLAAIATDQNVAQQAGIAPQGTALADAVVRGIHETDRIRQLRSSVTSGGILTSGAVVIITDGDDSTGIDPDATVIANTLSKVIAVGIGTDIEHTRLQAIGKNGSFLSPSPADWHAAFSEITDRVAGYPDAAYLLGYCSSAIRGTQNVAVQLNATSATMGGALGCTYNADYFSGQPGDVCNVDFLTNECQLEGYACGGLTACGACPNNECCSNYQCGAPTTDLDCDNDYRQCENGGQSCLPPEGMRLDPICGAGLTSGAACDATTKLCEMSDYYCHIPKGQNAGTCLPALPLGAICLADRDCESLHCARTKPEDIVAPKVCLPPAHLFQLCSTHDACERGGRCDGGICKPRFDHIELCTTGADCTYGACVKLGDDKTYCVGQDMCFWSWDEKVQ